MSVDQLLNAFLGTDNATRKAAEAAMEGMKKSAPADLSLGLLQMLRASPEPQKRQLCAVLLRKTVLYEEPGRETDDNSHALWYQLPENTRATICKEVLAAAQAELSEIVLRPLNHALAEIAGLVMMNGSVNWPELWTMMHACATGPSPQQQESAFILFEMLASYVAYGLKEHRDMFGAIFKSKLMDSSAPVRVRVAASKAAAAQLICSETAEEAQRFSELLPSILQALSDVVQQSDQEEASRELAGVLIEVAEQHATLFRKLLPQALHLLIGLAGNAAVDNEVRRLCLETVVTLAETAGGMVRKLPGDLYLTSLLPVVMGMLLEHGEEEPSDSEWEATSGADDAFGLGPAGEAEDCNVPVAEEALDRVGTAVGAKRFLPALAPLVRDYLAGARSTGPAGWKHRYAGLSAIGATASLVDEDDAILRAIASQVAPLAVSDPSPRVRWNAQYVIANFASHKGPAFQLAAHVVIGPAIIAGLRDASSVRVRTQASLGVIAFAEHLQGDIDDDVMRPYMADMLNGLFALMSLPATGVTPATAGRDRFAREQAITAISALCQAGRSLTTPYYDVIMPGLQQILAAPDQASSGGSCNDEASALARHSRLMKGKALECLSVLGGAVGPEKFRGDALAALGGIAGMVAQWQQARAAAAAGQQEGGSGDDPLGGYMWEALGRIAGAIDAADFAPFLPAVMPPLLAAVNEETKTSVVSMGELTSAAEDKHHLPAAAAADDDDSDDGFLQMEGAGGQVVRVRTADLEDKLVCTGTLATLMDTLKGRLMAPYAPAVMEGLLKLLRVSGTAFSDLRAMAAATVSDALASAAAVLSAADVAAVADTIASGLPVSPTSPTGAGTPAGAYVSMFSAATHELQACLKDEDEIEALKALLTGLQQAVEQGCKLANFATGTAPGGVKGDFLRLLTPDAMQRMTLSLLSTLQAAIQRRAVRKAELTVNAEDADEETHEEAGRKDRQDEEVLFHCVDALGTLIKSHTSAYLPVYSEYVASRVRDMAHPATLTSDRKHAVFLIDDVLEFVADGATCPPTSDNPSGHYAAEYLPVLVRCARDGDEAVRQAAVYGIGAAAASLSPSLFGPHLTSVLITLSAVVERPPNGKRGTAEDNAVTALGKVLIHQYTPQPAGAPVPRREIAAGFLKHLPLSHDDEEARVAAQMLCSFIESADSDVLSIGPGGPEPSRLAAILHNLGGCLRNKRVRNDDLVRRIGSVLAGLQAQLPASTLAAVWAALPAGERDALALAASGTAQSR